MSGELAGQGSCPANPTQGTNPDEWACTRDNVTNLVWSLDGAILNWTDSTDTYPSAMNATARCGFSSGWRLPTTHELLSIVHNGLGPAIDTNYFPGTYSGNFWYSGYYRSADTWAFNPTYAWGVDFNDGHSLATRKVDNYNVRLVHALPAQPSFTDNGDGTLTDTVNGLMWDQCSWGLSGSTCATGISSLLTWPQALGAVVSANAMNSGAGYKNHNDWRLPNKNELESLVNYSLFFPTIDTTVFPNNESDNYWSSTSYMPFPGIVWIVDFYFGNSDVGIGYYGNYVRLVRGGQPIDSFDSQTYTVTPIASANGSISPSTPQQVHGGTVAEFDVIPDAHYHTLSVSGCGGNWSGDFKYTTGTISADCTITASFAIDTFELNVTIAGAGTGNVTSLDGSISCPGTCQHTYDYGTPVELTAVADTGYTFWGWSGEGCSGTGTCMVSMTAARNVTATFTQGVDLVPTAVSTTATIVAVGTSFTISDTVKNQGTADETATNLVAGYYLSTDATITAADTYIGQRNFIALAAGASNSGSATVTVPANLVPGTYYIGVLDDKTNVQPESNEANNARAGAKIKVAAQGVDLKPTAVSTSATSVGVGASFTISDTVINQGVTPGTKISTARYYLSTDATITTADTILGQRSAIALGAGESSSGLCTVYGPSSLAMAPGKYYIGVIEDNFNEQPESNETNNALAGARITLVHDVDLIPLNVGASVTEVASGVTFTMWDTVKNQGTTPMIRSRANARYYLSPDTTITTADSWIANVEFLKLGAGESYSNSITLKVSPNFAPGKYYIGVIENYDNYEPGESNVTNNALAGAAITVVQNVDLVPTAVNTASASVAAGGAFTISDTVKNQGTSNMFVNYATRYYLSADATITETDIYLGDRYAYAVGAGLNSGGSLTVTVPKTLVPGTYYLGVVEDVYNAQPESNETNNALAGATITVH
jgi:hypothetical protein